MKIVITVEQFDPEKGYFRYQAKQCPYRADHVAIETPPHKRHNSHKQKENNRYGIGEQIESLDFYVMKCIQIEFPKDPCNEIIQNKHDRLAEIGHETPEDAVGIQ